MILVIFSRVLVHNSTAIPKREGKGVFPRPNKPYSPEPKARRPFCPLVFLILVTSQYEISVHRYIHIYPFKEHIIHYLYHFLCSTFVNLTFEENFLLAINRRCYTTLFTYLKYPTLLFYVLFKEKYFDVGIKFSCCSLFNICLMSAHESSETISMRKLN